MLPHLKVPQNENKQTHAKKEEENQQQKQQQQRVLLDICLDDRTFADVCVRVSCSRVVLICTMEIPLPKCCSQEAIQTLHFILCDIHKKKSGIAAHFAMRVSI